MKGSPRPSLFYGRWSCRAGAASSLSRGVASKTTLRPTAPDLERLRKWVGEGCEERTGGELRGGRFRPVAAARGPQVSGAGPGWGCRRSRRLRERDSRPSQRSRPRAGRASSFLLPGNRIELGTRGSLPQDQVSSAARRSTSTQTGQSRLFPRLPGPFIRLMPVL